MAEQTDQGMKIAGQVIRAAHERRGLNVTEAAKVFGMSRDVLNRLYRGDARIQAMWLRKIEGEFGWPTYLLTKIVEGDVQWVMSTPMDEDVRRTALEAMAAGPKVERRSSPAAARK